MDYGIADIIAADSWKLVRRAEQLGFSPAWFYDSLLFVADISVAMAAASRPQRFFAKTRRVGAIASSSVRPPPECEVAGAVGSDERESSMAEPGQEGRGQADVGGDLRLVHRGV